MIPSSNASSQHLSIVLEDAPSRALPLLQAIHARFGVGDGVVTARMATQFLRTLNPQSAHALGAWSEALPETGGDLLALLRNPDGGDEHTADLPERQLATDELLPVNAPPPLVESTNVEGEVSSPAPGRLDEQGQIFADNGTTALVMGTPELALALENMASALEEGGGWPAGAQSVDGRDRLMGRLEEAVAQGLGSDKPDGLPILEAVRLRVSAMSAALTLARREAPESPLKLRAASLLGHLLVGEPRRSVRAALAAAMMPLEDLPEDAGTLLLEATQELMPKAAPYAPWESTRTGAEPLWVRHMVYAPEYRQVKDGYEAAGFVRVNERPLQLQRDVPGGRPIRVELRRAPAAVVLNEDSNPEEILVLSGLASVVELVPSLQPRVVIAAFRRDPFGVPRLADRFPQDHLIACARGDKPLDDVGFLVALLQSLARREPYAVMKLKVREAAPLLGNRTLWPHEPGALRAAGGAPSPFSSDASAMVDHRLTWAIPRPARRPTDLKWRNDAPDTTSYLALEVATSLAGAPLAHEDLPVLEPGGFHEGLPDVEVSTGAALWRVSLTRGLCGQAEEALTALVTMHAHSRRGQMLGQKPRASLLHGALRAAQVASLQSSSQEAAEAVLNAVIRHGGIPSSLATEHLFKASRDPEARRMLEAAHQRWLDG